ncbi:hypothetical protein ASE07_25295 [Noviherbaspirillum sp. Root189]|nr:hypothetical protein ASE07_25295 [Noviherbaspirillum sp. Root189]
MEWTDFARTFRLFFAIAIAELAGCYLPLLWLTGKDGIWRRALDGSFDFHFVKPVDIRALLESLARYQPTIPRQNG